MTRFIRGLDKGTIAAAALLLTVVLAGWQLLEQHQDVVSKRHQIDALISTVQQHDAEAAADRTTAAANQRALLDYTAALAARQDALLAYLRAHGIHLPTRLVTVVPRPRIVVRHHRTTLHVKRHHSTTAGSGGSSTPAGPGKSGSAPGHRKHPRHGHRRH